MWGRVSTLAAVLAGLVVALPIGPAEAEAVSVGAAPAHSIEQAARADVVKVAKKRKRRARSPLSRPRRNSGINAGTTVTDRIAVPNTAAIWLLMKTEKTMPIAVDTTV